MGRGPARRTSSEKIYARCPFTVGCSPRCHWACIRPSSSRTDTFTLNQGPQDCDSGGAQASTPCVGSGHRYPPADHELLVIVKTKRRLDPQVRKIAIDLPPRSLAMPVMVSFLRFIAADRLAKKCY